MMVRNMLKLARKAFERPAVRFAVDALGGLVLFSAGTIAMLGPSAAAALPVVATVSGAQAAASGGLLSSSAQGDILVLAAAFSTLFALNLAFVRHLSTAYAAARIRARSEGGAPHAD